jgi:hypothetical protein
VCVFVSVSAYKRACGCSSVWACGCVCVRVSYLTQHSTFKSHIVTLLVHLDPPYFSTLFHKRYEVSEKVTEHKMGVFILSTTSI